MLWAAHVTHHSSQRYNLATALRQSWIPMTTLPFQAPLALLGIDPLMIVTVHGINLIYQFWIHTETIDRLPARSKPSSTRRRTTACTTPRIRSTSTATTPAS